MQKNSLNKVIIVGHLGANPEGRYTPSGRPVSNFSIATNEVWKKQSGSQEEHTEWHSVVVWDKLADFVQEYLYKGQLVSVEGRLHSRRWEDKEGRKNKVTEIMASAVVPLEWSSEKKG
tara:strand:- start:193 stop:546 length:354 start_codon:yes stop_codon:yes gene_type:complete